MSAFRLLHNLNPKSQTLIMHVCNGSQHEPLPNSHITQLLAIFVIIREQDAYCDFLGLCPWAEKKN